MDPNVDVLRTNMLIFGAIYIVICFCIAWIWGRKRRIGFLWSFVFSLLMTPLVGIAITLAGKKRDGEYL
jgi:hypothetical protein